MKLHLNGGEAAATLEALNDSILSRLRWCTSPDHTPYRETMPFELVQHSLHWMAQAYTKLAVEYRDAMRDSGTDPDEILEQLRFTEATWELLASIDRAKSWEGVAFHPNHPTDCLHCAAVRAVPR